jgi:hypothetical protein
VHEGNPGHSQPNHQAGGPEPPGGGITLGPIKGAITGHFHRARLFQAHGWQEYSPLPATINKKLVLLTTDVVI